MGKITDALNRAEKERKKLRKQEPIISLKREMVGNIGKKGMKNSLLIWIFIIIVTIVILFAFNNHGSKRVPLDEIFPDQEIFPVDVEYEFVENSEVRKNATEETAQSTQMVKEQVAIQEKVKTVNKVKTATAVVLEKEIKKFIYSLQVSSFKKVGRAREDVKRLKEKGYSAFIVSRDLGSKGVWYRVYVGKFETKDEAKEILSKLEKEFKGSFIRRIENRR